MCPFLIHCIKLAVWVSIGTLLMLGAGCRLMQRQIQATRLLEKSRSLNQEALFAMERGDLQEADRLLVQALRICPQDTESRARYSQLLWRCGKHEEALRQIQIALRLAPNQPDLHIQAAGQYLELGRLTEAQGHIEEVLRLAPKNSTGWLLQGRLVLSRGDADAALIAFHRALGLRPADREILQWIATAYGQKGHWEQVLAVRQRIIETYTPGEEPPEALVALAEAYQSVGRYSNAAQSYLEAARKVSDPEPYLLAAAENQWLAGEVSASATLAQQVLALDPQNRRARTLLARIQSQPDVPQESLWR